MQTPNEIENARRADVRLFLVIGNKKPPFTTPYGGSFVSNQTFLQFLAIEMIP
jgi:hypothetical protein